MVETTVGKVKVGTKLMLGQYGVSGYEIFPIMWLKATPNCDFIAAKVLDYICFDARERQGGNYINRVFGNTDYSRSNIMQFLNSEGKNWWIPMHASDSPPDRYNVCIPGDAYHDHCGFLHHFEEHEIESLAPKMLPTAEGVVRSLMRLPAYGDLIGSDRFQLFSRKGIRAHGTDDYIRHCGLRTGFDTGSYIEFWVHGTHTHEYPATLNRSGEIQCSKRPCQSAGLRPVCTLKAETVLEMDENGFCWVKHVVKRDKLFTDDEFFDLLGVVRP